MIRLWYCWTSAGCQWLLTPLANLYSSTRHCCSVATCKNSTQCVGPRDNSVQSVGPRNNNVQCVGNNHVSGHNLGTHVLHIFERGIPKVVRRCSGSSHGPVGIKRMRTDSDGAWPSCC